MYLKKLYQHSKFWFLVISIFIAGQLFINYKRGVVFSPFYHYGMYSSVIKPEAQYNIPEVFVNGERLAAKDFSPQEWDNIMQPVIKFMDEKEWNSVLWQTDIQRIFPFADAAKFTNSITEEEFNQWYQRHLQSILNKQVNKTEVVFRDYRFNSNKFLKTKN